MNKQDIFNHLRESEFSEEELGAFIDEKELQDRTWQANKTLAWFISKLSIFKSKREQRLRTEYRNKVSPELNNQRASTKFDRAQAMYKSNREEKRLKK